MSVGIGIERWTFRGTAMMIDATIKDDRMTSRESIELRRHAQGHVARGARNVEAEPASFYVCADPMHMPAVPFLMRCSIVSLFWGISPMYERNPERHWLLHVSLPAQPGMLHPTRPSSDASIQPGASTATICWLTLPTVVPPPPTLRTIAITSTLR